MNANWPVSACASASVTRLPSKASVMPELVPSDNLTELRYDPKASIVPSGEKARLDASFSNLMNSPSSGA